MMASCPRSGHFLNFAASSLSKIFLAFAFLCVVLVSALQDAWAVGLENPDPVTVTPLRGPIGSQPVYKLSQAINVALQNYPTLRYARAKVQQTDAGISLARTAYLPTFDLLWQELCATNNVIAGTIFPQQLDVIPIQSGIERHTSNFSSRLANNIGANFSWELYDFGLRHANVLLAKADRRRSSANVSLTELDVAAGAGENYLATVQEKETIRAQQATVKRMEAWQLIVHTLVDKGLRPGVDSARADSDLSFARIALIEAERDTELNRVDLSEAMGIAGRYIGIDDAPWIKRPGKLFNPEAYDIEQHPLAVLKASAVKVAQEQVHVWDRTWYPKLYMHSAIFGRGSAWQYGPKAVAGGLLPQIGNWVAGFSVSFPVASYYPIKAQKRMAARNEQAERANYDLAIQILSQKDARARVLLENARRIADETPVLVKAARENEIKALERYKVGLTNIVEVAEAERILARAEVEDAQAEVRVWRAILAVAYAQGNLKPFLDLVLSAEANI